MRTAGLPTFRKLYGRIPGGLKMGTYSLKIGNHYTVAPYEGKKYFMLSTTNSLGGINTTSAIIYIVLGVVSVLISLFFLAESMCFGKERNVA